MEHLFFYVSKNEVSKKLPVLKYDINFEKSFWAHCTVSIPFSCHLLWCHKTSVADFNFAFSAVALVVS